MSRQGSARAAARTATAAAAAVVFLLLSRSEIRKALLRQPALAAALAALVWIAAFLWLRRRRTGG